jgi:hypothetical protein
VKRSSCWHIFENTSARRFLRHAIANLRRWQRGRSKNIGTRERKRSRELSLARRYAASSSIQGKGNHPPRTKPQHKRKFISMSDNDFKPVRMTYVGRRLSSVEKLCYAWRETSGDILLYNDFRPHGCNIGTSFEVDRSETSIKINTARNPQDSDESLEDRAEWETKDRAAYSQFQEVKLIKRLNKDSAFKELVEPLQRVFHRLPRPDRQAFLVWLLTEVQNRPKD